MSKDELKKMNGLNRRQFLKLSAVSASAVAATMVVGCDGDSDSDSSTSTPQAVIPTENSWKFGIISDTQWTKDDDGENPASCAVEIINNLNEQFIKHGVDLVVHVGDLTDDARRPFTARNTISDTVYDYSVSDGFGVRARFCQALYNAGIGYFPLRGNHDDSQEGAQEFLNFFPQTTTGENNVSSVQEAAYAALVPEEDIPFLPEITRTKAESFVMGSNFSSPEFDAIKGLTYSFDHKNMRFVMLDHFDSLDGSEYPIATQQSWITGTLSSRASGTHAMTFSHKGLMTQDHEDIIFGYPASADSEDAADQDAYISALDNNGVRYHFCGHDHMHDRSYVYTTDGESKKVTQVVTASDSSKFYTPATTSNDETYCGGTRQKMLNQELYKVGYYIVTVDGDHATVEYYSSPAYVTDTFTTTPTLNFTLREKFGYSLNGDTFLVPVSESFTVVNSTSSNGTVAKILDGNNGFVTKDLAGRYFNIEVTTGWYDAQNSLSDILYLRGMDYTMGSEQTDVFTLSMSYDAAQVTSDMLTSGKFGLATLDADGTWIKAVYQNFSGTENFVQRAWKDGDALGTWGVDSATDTVWAVVNFNGCFAAVNNI
jgi:3',5'-cyclic AMP phosphodiesterase CpdA